MKTTPNRSVKKLREIIGRTQREFGNLIGVSKDTVVSWENGRNKLTPAAAFRIQFATAADRHRLMQNKSLTCYQNGKPYTKEIFDAWKSGIEDSTARLVDHAVDELKTILQAAARSGSGKLKGRFPAAYWSFLEWAKETTEGFNLETEIAAVLNDRGIKRSPTYLWRLW